MHQPERIQSTRTCLWRRPLRRNGLLALSFIVSSRATSTIFLKFWFVISVGIDPPIASSFLSTIKYKCILFSQIKLRPDFPGESVARKIVSRAAVANETPRNRDPIFDLQTAYSTSIQSLECPRHRQLWRNNSQPRVFPPKNGSKGMLVYKRTNSPEYMAMLYRQYAHICLVTNEVSGAKLVDQVTTQRYPSTRHSLKLLEEAGQRDES
jgi:hypothetical protein